MSGHYSPEEQTTGRRWWLIFSIINTFSFQFLAGNVIILFIIRLGASKTVVGVVSSFFHASYLIMPVGRLLSRRLGIVKGFHMAWMVRYLAISPLLLAPFIALSGVADANTLALIIVVGSYFGFQMIRGSGMVSLSPLLTELSHGGDRGRFLSLSRILSNISILFGVLIVALFLGDDAPLMKYLISFAAGIVLGYAGVYSLSRIPEIRRPEGHSDQGLKQSFRDIWKERKFRKYFATLPVVGFSLGIVKPFLLVYAKDVYQFSDNRVLFLTVAGSLGAIAMGVISRKFIDRVGAKPFMMIWILLMAAGALAIVLVPLTAGALSWVFLLLLFFIAMMGWNGADNTAQTYFFSLLQPQQQLSFGIVYFLTVGASGVAGASLAGMFLDLLQGPLGVEGRMSHVYLFAGVLAILVLAFFLAARMERLGALSFRRSLSELFSLRLRSRGR
ncbi:MFS transporter [Salinispira pacifica]|uniref:Major facilitator superfamily (MFS) profile domain-containing protein n=1 Tax=Salinispira pacifica TaxID=1307761 RepID=V5WL95_9SPIO|nr:MFS transporter [Salinispira pacifica]AHC16334.1 hypothetical protein L21SP2_2988 [Salinispira pacifica]